MHANANFGLHRVDKDGKTIYDPQARVEIGGSYTLLEADWNHKWLDTKYADVVTDVDVIVGRAEASAEGVLQFRDETGKFNPQADVGFNAEAIAFEVEASGKVETAIGDVGVTGKINYGLGVHADIGYKDGTLEVDVGASLGLGGSIKLEINATKTISAIKNWLT